VKQIYKHIETGALEGLRLGPRLLRIRTIDAIRFEHMATMSLPSELTPPRRRPDTMSVSHGQVEAWAQANHR
jgi:hypothetical protein